MKVIPNVLLKLYNGLWGCGVYQTYTSSITLNRMTKELSCCDDDGSKDKEARCPLAECFECETVNGHLLVLAKPEGIFEQ